MTSPPFGPASVDSRDLLVRTLGTSLIASPIPEVPFQLEGERGLVGDTDASGNKRLTDVGPGCAPASTATSAGSTWS